MKLAIRDKNKFVLCEVMAGAGTTLRASCTSEERSTCIWLASSEGSTAAAVRGEAPEICRESGHRFRERLYLRLPTYPAWLLSSLKYPEQCLFCPQVNI
jgi:hypothetical protein